MKKVNDNDAKKILVEILNFFDKFCREQNLHYSVAGGTLIGALRHKGFIPWDDDIDVFMPRDEYSIFLEKFNSDIYKLIKVEKGSWWYTGHARITDPSTIIYWGEYTPHHGLWLSVMPIDGYPGDEIWNKQKKSLLFWDSLGRLKNTPWIKSVSLPRNILKKVGKFLLFPISSYYIGKKIESIISKYPIGSTEELGHHSTYMIHKNHSAHHFDGDCMDNYIDVDFEGLKVMAMAGYDKYLTKIFGDWHELPPEEKRVSHGYIAYYIDK